MNENVFAYSNRRGDKRGLVLYNNSFSTVRGTIHYSAAYADKGSGQLRQRRLSEGLEMTNDSAVVLGFRDSLTGLEYLQRASKIANEGFSIELRGYQCHIFLDWRELRASFEKPWDRLCDQLNGSGVPNLEDALVNLELRPVHDALRELLEPSLVRMLADLSELPRSATGIEKKQYELQKNAFFELAWNRAYEFLRRARMAYNQRARHVEGFKPASLDSLASEFRERLRAAMRIPGLESYFATPWSAGARRVLPSRSPKLTATAMWGPVLSWCVLELLAESIDAKHPELAAVDVFDRLRLRQPLGIAFGTLGFEAEENWRVAARIKVALLVGSGVLTEDQDPVAGKAEVSKGPVEATSPIKPAVPPLPSPAKPNMPSILSPVLWKDPDVQWLTGVHKADGKEYFKKESYEDLLWWLQLPCLFTLGAQATPDRAKITQMTKSVVDAQEAAETAGYRVDVFLGQDEPEEDADEVLPSMKTETATLEKGRRDREE